MPEPDVNAHLRNLRNRAHFLRRQANAARQAGSERVACDQDAHAASIEWAIGIVEEHYRLFVTPEEVA